MDLVEIASAALETGKFEDLGKALQLQRKRPDSFRILLSDKLSSVLMAPRFPAPILPPLPPCLSVGTSVTDSSVCQG